ncbi:hypothetical protein TOPH_00261 [Tolypocladium ophioglossoides CBS 100239]|uniref:Uncharacterized protein n=1 Tax=Tolypocladium ophioglossoides (strain CBS 100239) TaxID=1163406 RepID=A0A0L0NKT6_TOLOC|nr:hypothetical protein TOPH_00261 [Tolypocladium ophioglossoides CBS 100239]
MRPSYDQVSAHRHLIGPRADGPRWPRRRSHCSPKVLPSDGQGSCSSGRALGLRCGEHIRVHQHRKGRIRQDTQSAKHVHGDGVGDPRERGRGLEAGRGRRDQVLEIPSWDREEHVRDGVEGHPREDGWEAGAESMNNAMNAVRAVQGIGAQAVPCSQCQRALVWMDGPCCGNR